MGRTILSAVHVTATLALLGVGFRDPVHAFQCALPVTRAGARHASVLRPLAQGRAASSRRGPIMTAVSPRGDVRSGDASGIPTERVRYYDTTLRDGAQGEGISLSCDDKLRIAARLHRFGADYIEGGWPGSNPKDAEFFRRAKTELSLAAWGKVAAFGSTRYKNIAVEEDKQVQMLVDSGARIITLVGKSWDLHVDEVLETTREENLAMIRDTVRYLKALDKEVMLDAEHFFDGHRANAPYAMACLGAAVEAGVDWLVLCDTNGGTLPWDIEALTVKVRGAFPGTRIGIHCHNDQGMAVANSLASVRGGATVIQGTVNGYGERTGNANVMSILPTLVHGMGADATPPGALRGLTSLSRYVDEQANQPAHPRAAFVGASAFALRPCFPGAGARDTCLLRIDPEEVGNNRVTPVSIAGAAPAKPDAPPQLSPALFASLRKYGDEAEVSSTAARVLATVRALDLRGYFFEGADASVELMLRRSLAGYQPPFDILDYHVDVWDDRPSQYGRSGNARATVKLRVAPETVNRFVIKELRKLGDLAASAANLATLSARMAEEQRAQGEEAPGTLLLEVAEGNGPVNALGQALVKALLPLFPSLENVELRDYKVRILDNDAATAAIPRVMIEFVDTTTGRAWTTAAADSNIISASFNALVDGVEFYLERRAEEEHDEI